MNISLGDVQETALIPLAIRADETMRKNNRITDIKAVEIIKALGIGTKKYDKFFSHEGIVARTILFDETVGSLIIQHENAVCINIGCGLDDRFTRVDNGKILWYDVDLPDSIAVRKKAFAESDRVKMIAGNVLSNGWADGIPKEKTVIVIAEVC